MTLEENIFLAKRNLVDIIWKSANLEGINVTFPETQMIIDGYSIANKTIDELNVILNLKKAWQFLFDNINEKITLSLIQDFHRIVGRDLIYKSGFLRTADVRISGTNYKPKLPIDYEVSSSIEEILNDDNQKDIALNLMLYIMRNQLFFDGNKRVAMLLANKVLIQNGLGILSVCQEYMNDFFTKLINFYENNDSNEIKKFCNIYCIETMTFKQSKKSIMK
ncbi:Fic family protein [Helicobacter sp. MIT 14-3879]|uniref:Fic family protein n=1 Tax=Helicobacter sp. MIT 14-3879 TaxID=2040649 RepID=UPI000E1ED8A0|nr:Fic family protein [Helicobacter sp. MIT 14-3879]RDU61496.1 cell filamentation protein Fic [Helicobacter sp. MIT 14-3879]